MDQGTDLLPHRAEIVFLIDNVRTDIIVDVDGLTLHDLNTFDFMAEPATTTNGGFISCHFETIDLIR